MKAAATRLLPLLAIIPACALGGDDGSSISQAISGTASISLSSSSAAVTLTSDAQWTLRKTGSVSGNTVTWNITATKTATVSGQLVVQGQLTVTNGGSGPATIGNIVANLQTRQNNTWKSVSADVADATNGDAATTAKIHSAASSEGKSSFTENSASGTLQFMDATNNTVFSLVPEVSINAGQTRTLLFQATYNNNILHLATGTQIRAEVIVSFGNATNTGNSTANVDINGSGAIDWDEHRVRSVPSRLTLSVPQQTSCNAAPTLTDTLSDIKSTGTVTFGSTWFNLGATSGTVTTTVSGGASGGTITNCAHLKSGGQTIANGGFTFQQAAAIDLTACNTQTIGANTCTPGTAGCGWSTGDESSFTQFNWASSAGGAPLLTANYSSVYASSAGVFTIGVASATAFSMSFTAVTNLLAYIPATGTSGSLTSDLVNPTTSASGQFGGDVAALKLNIDFSDANLLTRASSTAFGDLTLCGVTPSSLNGSNVRALLTTANNSLGAVTAFSTDLAQLVSDVNVSFVNGAPSTFAEDHLFVGSCPP